ncbi:MAG TPA: DUF6265 family protein [Candidatus Polarisedimenticolia bacterium]|nr:DUF6265 family protein [Candidatus Polarisedimenticolia bacterium]
MFHGMLVMGMGLSAALAAGQPEAGRPAIDQLAWMAGSWGGESEGTTMEEHWTAPAGGLMLGMHRDVSRQGKAFFEFLRVEARPDGVYYVASPMGKGATAFKLTESSGQRAVFENPQHDFPKRILYWIERGALRARVEGDPSSKERAMEWTWLPLRGR